MRWVHPVRIYYLWAFLFIMKSYSEKLKDPRWQKKRLEILQRDDFMCKSCFDKESQLQIHHLYYDNKLEPWEYENIYLITLCEKCHKDFTEINNEIKKILGTFDNIDSLVEVYKLLSSIQGCIPTTPNLLRKFHELIYISDDNSLYFALESFIDSYLKHKKQ